MPCKLSTWYRYFQHTGLAHGSSQNHNRICQPITKDFATKYEKMREKELFFVTLITKKYLTYALELRTE